MDPSAESPVLERERELDVVSARLDAAGEGRGSLVVIEGPAGIGKTTLIQAASRLAEEREMKVLRSRGGIMEQQCEYGIARQLVERPLYEATPEQRERLLAGPAAASTAALGFGELPADPGPGGDPSSQIQHSLHWLIANMAEERPVLITLDDAHWGDRASLCASGYLARRIGSIPVVLLVGTRDDEPASQWQLLVELFAAADPEYLRPKPLSVEAVADVLLRAFNDSEVPAELAQACRRATGGNPFLLSELVSELEASHPDLTELSPSAVDGAEPLAVRRSLLLRLGNLGPGARQLAQAIAILGGEGELRHAAAVAGLGEDDAKGSADLLAAAGIVEQSLPLRLIHPLVRAAIAEDTPPADRADAHRRAFEALAADGARDQQLLPHLIAADPVGDQRVNQVLGRLAELALRTGSPEAAATYLARSLAEPPSEQLRPKVLAALGRAEVRAGQFDTGLNHLDQALSVTVDSADRAENHRDRAFAAFAGAGIDEAKRVVAESVKDLGDTDSDGALQLEADLAMFAWLAGAEHGLDLGRHRELAGATRAERTVLALLAQEDHALGAPPSVVVELANRALSGGRLIDEDTSEALSWYLATYALLTCEAHAEARATIDHAIADSRGRGSAFARAGALGTRAVLALNEGRPRDAEADAREAAAGAMPPIMVPVNAAYLVLSLTDQGDLEAAELELEAAGINQGPGGPTVLRWIPWARARLREAQGRPEDVRADVGPLEEDHKSGRPMRALAWKALLSRSLSRRDDETGEAGQLASEHLEWAETWGCMGALGVAQRAAALCQPNERKLDRLEGAVDTLEASSLKTEEALARLDFGIAQLRSGFRRDGIAALEVALTVATEVGARGTAKLAAVELEIAGTPPKRLAFDELTASERRIAEHAAGGLTNRQIAEELFVTPKTVENHLTRVYGKLGIASRRELAGAL